VTTYQFAHEFLRPVPYHALLPESLAAVEAMQSVVASSRIDRLMASIVTDHGNPRVVPFDGDVVAPTARLMLAKAEHAGFTAQLLELPRGCVVEGYRRRDDGMPVCFRARWRIHVAGSGAVSRPADGASWHEPWRYEMGRDDRPVGINKQDRVALAGKRGAGLAAAHMRLVASPWGMPIDHTELKRRIAQYDT